MQGHATREEGTNVINWWKINTDKYGHVSNPNLLYVGIQYTERDHTGVG
jgi:hypothetical protein